MDRRMVSFAPNLASLNAHTAPHPNLTLPERSEHWSRLLSAASLDYEGIEQEWREREDGLAEDFEERVRSGMEGLERVLGEMEGVE